MPHIIPIRDLAKTAQISEICHETNEPVFVTKNGYADLVIMSAKAYDRQCARMDMIEKLNQGEEDVRQGRISSGREFLKELEKEYAE